MTDKAPSPQRQPKKNIYVKPRGQLVDWLRQQLVGPATENATRLDALPTERFPCGALYPTSPWGDGIDAAGEELPDEPGVNDPSGEEAGEPAVVRRYVPPSSLGFSFFVRGRGLCRDRGL